MTDDWESSVTHFALRHLTKLPEERNSTRFVEYLIKLRGNHHAF
jgi:hypothetical protein